MAPATGTAYQVHITPQNSGLWEFKQTEETAKKASELLQKDLQEHHVFFNEDGFHNHIPHHILALYGTGAGAEALQKGYDANTGYQRPVLPPHGGVIEDLKDWDHAKKYLGKEKYYPDFLRFFQKEIDKKGWENVMNEYVFKGDEAADDVFGRLFAGFLHPIIQLMYGMEWAQPAIVAEALAQTSVHGNDLNPFLFEAEKEAAQSSAGDMPSIVSLYKAVHDNDKLANSVRMEDSNKVRDGVLVRARAEMLKVASRVKVRPEQLEEKTAEMFHSALYMAAAAAIHPPKHPKFDFFFIHHVNSAPIFLTINAQPWISTEVKVRILEWKIRMDLVQYAARAVPPLSLDSITLYRPRDESGKMPADVVSRLHLFDDDGHAIKLGRAAGICQELSTKYQGKDWTVIRGDDVWMKVHRLIVDSVEAPGPHWVRTTGLDEAWENVPDAPDAKL
ncbi:HypA protein [Phialemonium atrogriseum]|uniref:HypA protein n=1 Tax=Phialemonium atrogriseum TaxID=1093897 RepID=A0AAJ0BZZ4_9PEZI|nr:HypA protein [Phialemonium atrogriseum]KAK1766177.1 HypA protein [Phialemonium atrogriseum]